MTMDLDVRYLRPADIGATYRIEGRSCTVAGPGSGNKNFGRT